MALPVITSVTQATAPQSGNTTQPDTATWSSALAAADTSPQTEQTSANADNARTEGGTADTGSAASTGTQSSDTPDNATATPAQKKPAKHEASAVAMQGGDTAQTDSASNTQQNLSPFTAMLLNNTAAADQGMPAVANSGSAQTSAQAVQTAAPQTVAKVAPEETKVVVQAAVVQPEAGNIVVEPDGSAANTPTPAASTKAETTDMAGVTAASADQAVSTSTSTIATAPAQAVGVTLQSAQVDVTGSASSTGTSQGTQAPAAVTVSAAAASVSKSTPSTAASLLARSAAQQAVTAKSDTSSQTTQVLQPADASSISAMAQASATSPTSATAPVAAASTVVAASSTVDSASVTASSASALAATVTAMHQAGQSGAVLRLDPPGLGNLSVHVGVGQQGQVNVLFVPDSSAGAQALQSGLNGLSQAMTQSGLTLGQAQVGGQFGQSAGQGGQNSQGWSSGRTSTPERNTTETSRQDNSGVSAYA